MAIATEFYEPLISWEDAFNEGERRIKARFLNVMIRIPSRDRMRLLVQRETVRQKIHDALSKNNNRQLRQALREQVKLLSKIGYRV